MRLSQIKQMYVWTHKTSAVRNISVVQTSRKHCDAASQEMLNCSFNTKLYGFCLIDVFQILFWHKYILTSFFLFFLKKNKIKIKTSTLNLKSISLSAIQQSIQWNALRGLFTLISPPPPPTDLPSVPHSLTSRHQCFRSPLAAAAPFQCSPPAGGELS